MARGIDAFIKKLRNERYRDREKKNQEYLFNERVPRSVRGRSEGGCYEIRKEVELGKKLEKMTKMKRFDK